MASSGFTFHVRSKPAALAAAALGAACIGVLKRWHVDHVELTARRAAAFVAGRLLRFALPPDAWEELLADVEARLGR